MDLIALARRAAILACLALCVGAGDAVAASDKYCAEAAPNVVIYVDKTTPYDEADKTALIDGISRVFESLAGGERFVVRTITDSFVRSDILIDDCVPYCPEGNILADLFNGSCTEGVMLNDRKHLRGRVVAQLRSLLETFVELPYSEIVETVARSASDEYRADHANNFFLFTDLIQNSKYLPGRDFFLSRTRRS